MTGQTPRRIKAYTAQTGYVYQYYFVGKRRARDIEATEYVFDVSSDRKTYFAVSVFVRTEAVAAWGNEHGRNLSDTEQYASAKLRLMAAFDSVPDLKTHGKTLFVDPDTIDELLEPLDLT